MPSSLPRSTPADHKVDPAAILGFLDAIDARPDIEMHSLMVVRHGHVVAEGWWAPYSAGRPHLLYSLSKSFTSTAAAFAQAEGLLDLDDAVVGHFPEFAAEITDPRTRSVKIRHVAAMASGHNREMLPEAMGRDRDEPVRGFLLIPPDREPGTVFAYSQPGRGLRWLARRPHPARRDHLPGNAAPDGHHLRLARAHRRGRVAPSAAQPQQAPAPALSRLDTSCRFRRF